MTERKIRLIALGILIILIVMVGLVFNLLGGQTNQSTYSGESVYSEPSTEQTSSITQESITQESITQESITQESITQESIAQESIAQDEREQAYIDEYNRLAQDYQLDESTVTDYLEQEGLEQYKVGESTQEQPNTNQSYIDTTGKTNEQIVVELYQSNPAEFERQFKELVKDYREEKNQELQKAIQAQKDKGIYIEPKYLQDGSPNPRYGQ